MAVIQSSPPTGNRAAYLVKAGQPVQIKTSEVPHAKPDYIIVKSRAVAINPVDWMLQYVPFIFSHLKTPFVMGADVAGEVVEIGSNVTRFRVGDRVLGHALGIDKRSDGNVESGFQEYVALRESMSSAVPDTMKFEEACVLPLGVSTAACGLYQKDYLAMRHPSISPTSTGESLIVWGASTSVGCNAVQLARASGYDVIATCSPRNFDYVKSLGAKAVFDYRDETVTEDIIKALKGRRCAGAVAVCDGSTEACIKILSASEGRKFIAQMSMPLASSDITTFGGKVSGFMAVIKFNIMLLLRSKLSGVQVKFVFGSDLVENKVCDVVFRDFLPEGLAERKFVVAPPPIVVGNGLERVQEALDMNRRGVSAGKVVVTLP